MHAENKKSRDGWNVHPARAADKIYKFVLSVSRYEEPPLTRKTGKKAKIFCQIDSGYAQFRGPG